MIIDSLIEKIKETGNPSVIGLDPHIDILPTHLTSDTSKSITYAIFEFNRNIMNAVCGIVPAVKPQIAFYEQFGVKGIECYIKTVSYAKRKGFIVIGDIKRGDVPSTAEAYSAGHLGTVKVRNKEMQIFGEDFVTVNPYLGSDSVEPFLNDCKKFDKGIFVLVKTSNKGSADFQDLDVNGKKLYEVVGERVSDWGKDLIGEYGFSSVGAVVGATHPKDAAKLRKAMPQTFFLVPGYGAQGGKAADLAVYFDKNGLGALINSSRGILAAYKNYPKGEEFYAEAARQAALDMRKEIRSFVN